MKSGKDILYGVHTYSYDVRIVSYVVRIDSTVVIIYSHVVRIVLNAVVKYFVPSTNPFCTVVLR